MLKSVFQRVLLLVGGVAVALVLLEAVSFVGYWAISGHRFSRDEFHTMMLETAEPKARRKRGAGEYDMRGVFEVIHPYLGFVPDPSQSREQATIGDPGQILPPSKRELIVGLFGGSFAAGLCNYGAAELKRVLARPRKRVRLLCMAAGGFKQPQQFLALAYLLAQGAHFDLVINVDGFNEVSLPPVENKPQGVAPIYPRGWFWRVGNLKDPAALKLVGELSAVDRARQQWANLFLNRGLDRSVVLALVWQSRDRVFAAERGEILTAVRDHNVEQERTYAATGPKMEFADNAAYAEYLARIWKDSSLQMKLLCDANGIPYAHFLQPNQYVPDSKPMTSEERLVAIGPGPYSRGVGTGYPLLQRGGEELRLAGVGFHDLTAVFKEVQEPLYSDACCHVNAAGYNIVARAIGEYVRSDAVLMATPTATALSAGSPTPQRLPD